MIAIVGDMVEYKREVYKVIGLYDVHGVSFVALLKDDYTMVNALPEEVVVLPKHEFPEYYL